MKEGGVSSLKTGATEIPKVILKENDRYVRRRLRPFFKCWHQRATNQTNEGQVLNVSYDKYILWHQRTQYSLIQPHKRCAQYSLTSLSYMWVTWCGLFCGIKEHKVLLSHHTSVVHSVDRISTTFPGSMTCAIWWHKITQHSPFQPH